MAGKRKEAKPHKPFWMVKNPSGNRGAVKVQMPVAGRREKFPILKKSWVDGANATFFAFLTSRGDQEFVFSQERTAVPFHDKWETGEGDISSGLPVSLSHTGGPCR